MAPSQKLQGWAKISEMDTKPRPIKKPDPPYFVKCKLFRVSTAKLRHGEDRPRAAENGCASHTRCRTGTQNPQLSKLSSKTTNDPVKKPAVKTLGGREALILNTVSHGGNANGSQ